MPDDERLVQDDEAADERPLRDQRVPWNAGFEALRGDDDPAVGMAQGDGDRVAAAHQDALDEGLAAVGEAGHRGVYRPDRIGPGPGITTAGPSTPAIGSS